MTPSKGNKIRGGRDQKRKTFKMFKETFMTTKLDLSVITVTHFDCATISKLPYLNSVYKPITFHRHLFQFFCCYTWLHNSWQHVVESIVERTYNLQPGIRNLAVVPSTYTIQMSHSMSLNPYSNWEGTF
jgi:hypothetical protein